MRGRSRTERGRIHASNPNTSLLLCLHAGMIQKRTRERSERESGYDPFVQSGAPRHNLAQTPRPPEGHGSPPRLAYLHRTPLQRQELQPRRIMQDCHNDVLSGPCLEQQRVNDEDYGNDTLRRSRGCRGKSKNLDHDKRSWKSSASSTPSQNSNSCLLFLCPFKY